MSDFIGGDAKCSFCCCAIIKKRLKVSRFLRNITGMAQMAAISAMAQSFLCQSCRRSRRRRRHNGFIGGGNGGNNDNGFLQQQRKGVPLHWLLQRDLPVASLQLPDKIFMIAACK
jgi:hypothetical protein